MPGTFLVRFDFLSTVPWYDFFGVFHRVLNKKVIQPVEMWKTYRTKTRFFGLLGRAGTFLVRCLVRCAHNRGRLAPKMVAGTRLVRIGTFKVLVLWNAITK